MKKGNLFTAFVLLTLVVCNTFTFTSCSSDNTSDLDTITKNPTNNSNKTEEPAIKVEEPFKLVLKALDVTGEDRTTKGDVACATLFVFDEQGYFLKQISIDKTRILNRQTIEISADGNKTITVIAWGGLSDKEVIPTMTPANMASDLQISIKENEGISTGASDLFYGQLSVNKTNTDKQELAITRKMSSFVLKTDGIKKENGATYEYRISKTKNAFNGNGEVTGNDIEYVIPATFDKNESLAAQTSAVLPASDITIELYKDGQLIFSAEKDQNGKNISAKAGKQQNLVFEKKASSFATNLVVAPWGVVVQYVVVG